MFAIENCIDAIHSAYPELEITSAVPDVTGQFNFVLLVNDTLIFRFPRYAQGIAVLEREAAILDAVCYQLPLPVPMFTYRSLESSVPGRAFVGYRRLPGILLRGETLNSIQIGKSRHHLAKQMAGFMDALHHVPPATVKAELPLKGTRSDWTEMYSEIRTLLFPHMRPDARDWVTRHFETFLEDTVLQEFQFCLIHGDFGPGNILYDPESHNLCGVIDFGFAALGDPAQDIAAASCFGDDFFENIATSYPHLQSFIPRARFIKGTFALEEALHGIKSGDEDAFTSGMEQYR